MSEWRIRLFHLTQSFALLWQELASGLLSPPFSARRFLGRHRFGVRLGGCRCKRIGCRLIILYRCLYNLLCHRVLCEIQFVQLQNVVPAYDAEQFLIGKP